jgi:hypothetical protein
MVEDLKGPLALGNRDRELASRLVVGHRDPDALFGC